MINDRPLDLTIPDSETYVPEFGLNIPPEFAFNFDDLESPSQPEDTADLNLSDALHTPLPRHEFSLPSYNLSLGPASNDSGFGDYTGDAGFGYDDDDDDILRNVDDAGNLDFNLDTPTYPRKRGAQDDLPTEPKRVRVTTSADDDEIQRMAREDHDMGNHQFNDFGDDGGGFGDVNFDVYGTPPPVSEVPVEEVVKPKKRRRVVIVEDNSSTIPDDEFRSWPQRYRETQDIANFQHMKNEMKKLAQKRATQFLWGWGAKTLHPSLADMFSREALLARWKREPVGLKRKRHENGELEYAMEFGDGGGFGDGGFDYSVSFLVNEFMLGNGDWPSRGRCGRRPLIHSIVENAME